MPPARSRAVSVASYGERQPSQDLGSAGGGHVCGGEDVLERQRHPGQRGCRLLAGGQRLVDGGRGAQRRVGRHVQEGVVALVGCLDLVQAGPGDLDRRQLLGGDLGGQRRCVEPDDVCHWLSPRIWGTAKRPSTAAGASASASCLREAGGCLVRSRHVDVLERIVGRFDAGDIDRLDLADVGQDGVELAGEAVQLGIGQRQPGQLGQVGDLVAGDLGHERKA